MDINLVVADTSLAEKTICLAVSPSLKAYGIPGRARLFEVIQKMKKANEKCCRNTRIEVLPGSLLMVYGSADMPAQLLHV